MIPRCAVTVEWYGLDMIARCVRPEHHDGPHRDGVWWWDDHGLRVPQLDEPRSPRGTAGHPRGCGCDYHVKAREYARRKAARKVGTAA